jgi:hypothetical protein
MRAFYPGINKESNIVRIKFSSATTELKTHPALPLTRARPRPQKIATGYRGIIRTGLFPCSSTIIQVDRQR